MPERLLIVICCIVTAWGAGVMFGIKAGQANVDAAKIAYAQEQFTRLAQSCVDHQQFMARQPSGEVVTFFCVPVQTEQQPPLHPDESKPF